MCVYPLMVPTSSLSISLPPGVPAHMPAWTTSVVTRVRTLPASLGHETVCVEVCACIHLLRLRWAVWQITPDPPESAARVRIALVTDVEYVHTREPIHLCTLRCARIRPRVSGSIFISNRRVWPPTADITLHPLLSPISVFWTRWGARVTSDPPPLCDWWDSPALSPPPLLFPDGHLTQLWPIY